MWPITGIYHIQLDIIGLLIPWDIFILPIVLSGLRPRDKGANKD